MCPFTDHENEVPVLGKGLPSRGTEGGCPRPVLTWVLGHRSRGQHGVSENTLRFLLCVPWSSPLVFGAPLGVILPPPGQLNWDATCLHLPLSPERQTATAWGLPGSELPQGHMELCLWLTRISRSSCVVMKQNHMGHGIMCCRLSPCGCSGTGPV